MCLLPSLKWSSTVSFLGIVQWNFTRRDHPGDPGRVSGSGPVSSSLRKPHLSRLCLSVATNVSSSFSVTTYITLSRQKSFSESLPLSQPSFSCCDNLCHDRRSLVTTEFMLSACFICRDKSFFVTTNSSWC